MAPPAAKRKAASSSSASKSSSAKKPDFKRIKAKVGKKAIKPANVTDTSFKAASLHVRAQTVETTTAATAAAAADASHLFLTSSRGKTLQELASQLQHPAPNVRLSAAKGLHDAVLTTTTKAYGNKTRDNAPQDVVNATATAAVVIQAHLVILIPAIGQCLMDETDDVRRLGLNILQQVLRKLSQQQDHDASNNNNRSTTTTSTASTTTTTTIRALRPFASLLLAFLSCGLNSLDRDVRKDGALAIAAVSRAAPALVAPLAANSLLPAVVRLFEDAVFVRQANVVSSASNSNNNSARREGQKRKGGGKSKSSSSGNQSSSSTWHFLLQCLLSVLQTLDVDNQQGNTNLVSTDLSGGEPDWIFETGGQAKNALLVIPGPQRSTTAAASQRRRRLYPMRSLSDVASALHELYYSSSSSTSSSMMRRTTAASMLSEKTARQLLEKLRDVFIELTDNNNNILMANATNLDTFLLLSKCLRLLSEQLVALSGALTEESSRRVMMQLNGYILELFPLVAVVGSNDANSNINSMSALVNEINGQLCLTLMSMSALSIQANDEKSASKWQGKVFNYIQSSLLELDLTTCTSSSQTSVSSSSSKHVLDGFRRLYQYCHPSSGNDTNDDNNNKSLASKQTRLVKAFANSFFPESSSLLNLEAARSYTGRQSVGLASMIFRSHDFELHRLAGSLGKKDAARIVQGLVDYLIAWSGDFPTESEAVLRLLHAIMIRVDTDVINVNTSDQEEESQDLCSDLRRRLEPIFAPFNANDGGTSSNASSCIFERYPEHLQRLVIGFVLTLGPPSKTTLSALARVCGRANSAAANGCNTGESSAAAAPSTKRPAVLSADAAAFVIHSMYNIRQSLAMSDFLTFLLDGMGIIQVDATALVVTTTNNNNSSTQEDGGHNDTFQSLERLVQFDRGLQDASFCLVGCGSQKVLSMLYPLLSRWLEEQPAKEPTTKMMSTLNRGLLQSRAALALMAMFSLDMNATFCDSSTSIFNCLAAESFESTVAKSIVRLLQYTPTETSTAHEYAILQSWISPIVSLITSEPVLLPLVFRSIADSLTSATMKEAGVTQQQQQQQQTIPDMVLQSFLWLCRRPQLSDLLQHCNQDLLQYTSRMEKAVAGGPLERIVGHITGTVELHAKQQQQQAKSHGNNIVGA